MNELICSGNPCEKAQALAETQSRLSADALTVVRDSFKILDGIARVHTGFETAVDVSPVISERVVKGLGLVSNSRRRTLRILDAIDNDREKAECSLRICQTCTGIGSCALASTTE